MRKSPRLCDSEHESHSGASFRREAVLSLLLQVALNRVGIARLGLVWAHACVAKCTPPAQQIPADIEFDLNGAKARRIGLQCLACVALLAAAQLMLLRHQAVDPRSNGLVAHGLMLRG